MVALTLLLWVVLRLPRMRVQILEASRRLKNTGFMTGTEALVVAKAREVFHIILTLYDPDNHR